LIGNELVEIGVGEHAALAALAVAKGDVFQRAGGNVAVEGFHRAAEPGSGLCGGLEPVRWKLVQLAGGTLLPPKHKPFAVRPQTFRTIKVLATEPCELRGQACDSRRIFL
jgi:hypothetical protein